jgi:exosortase E/protease (VPEID-CTERM system)
MCKEPVSDAGRAECWTAALLVRWSGLVLLLVAELLALGLRFDTESLAGQPQWWAKAVDAAPAAPAILIAVATAIIVLGGARLRDALGRGSCSVSTPQRSWPYYLLCHLLSFAAFTALTWFILEGEMGDSAYPGLWFFGWVMAGVGALAFWGAAAVRPRLWPGLLRQTFPQILIGIVVGIAAWRCGGLTGELWRPMSSWTFEFVRVLVGLVVPECHYEPARYLVGTSSFSVCIDKQCSGYQGIGLICVFLAFYLWFYRKTLRFPHALLLVPLGVAAIWLANVLRIAALILIGIFFSPDVALGGFHSLAGWLAFNAVALGLVAVSNRSRFFNAAISPHTNTSNPTAPYLAPFLVALAVAMVTGAFSSNGFDWLYPVRVLAVLGTIWYFRKAYAQFPWSWSWHAVALGAIASVLWILLTPTETGAGGISPSALAGVPVILAAGWWFFRAVGYVIAAPLAEELAFRGYLTRRLISADFEAVPLGKFSWLSFLISSAVFGAFHGHAWLAGCLAGMLFFLALYHCGRMSDAVLAHATANGMLAIYAAATGNWHLWS